MLEFVTGLFDTSGFVPRMDCGEWTPALVWLHVGGDLFIWLAYLSIPLILLYFTRRDLPYPRLFVLFSLFILACGFLHLLEALMFKYPLYRLAGVWKVFTAVVSWATVLALIPVVPRVMAAASASAAPAASGGVRDTTLHRLAAPGGQSRLNDYIIAVLAGVLALLLRAAMDELAETDHLYVLSLLAVVFVSWQSGFGPGILTLLISMVGMVYFFVPPRYSLVVEGFGNQLATAMFFFCGVCCAGLGEAQRLARRGTKAALAVALEQKDELAAEVARRREAEESVRRSERNLSDFFENANVGLHWVGPDGVILRANRAELEMLGYDREEYVGRPITVFHASAETIDDILTRLKGGEKLENYPARLRRKDGAVRDVLISSSVLWEDGRFVHTRCFTRDVTEQKRTEGQLAERARVAALRAEVAETLAVGNGVKGALQACAETIVRHLGAAFARVWTTDESGGWLELQASAGMYTHTDGPHGRVRVGEFKIGRIAASGRPHLTNDVPHDPNVSDPAWAAREGMVAFAGYPLVVEGRVLGVMALFSREPLSDGLTAELAPVADAVAQYLERRRADEAARASEDRFRTLTEAIPQVVWNADAGGEVTYVNRRWLDYTGEPLDRARGRGWLDAAHPDDRAPVFSAWRQTVDLAAAGSADRFARELRLRDAATGEYRWFLTVAVPLRRPGGSVDQWIGSMADIHDQKTAAAKIAESEEKFRTMADSIPQLAWMTDADGYIFWYNQRWYDYTGTTLDQVKGWGWQSVHDPAELARMLPGWKAALAAGEPWEDTFPLRRHDGAMRWHLSRARPIRDDAGKIVRWFGTNTDVTAQREMEQALRDAAQRFRTLTEAVPQMVWTADPAGAITSFNRRWDEYTGLPVVPGRAWDWWAEVIHPDDLEQLRAGWQLSVAQAPDKYSNEFRLRRGADGEYRWMLSAAMPLRDPTGGVAEWVGSITDIDDQKRYAENLERTVRERTAALVDEVEERVRAETQAREVAAELARSNGELEQFAYIASHDLQEPLRKIQAFGNRLVGKFRDDLPELGREYVDRMQVSAGRMRRLIDDLLSFSRVTTHARPFTRLDLGKIAREVVSDLSERIEPAGAEVRVGELPAIDADPTQMRQLFQNLIANAVKFQKPGVPPVVEIEAASVTEPLPRPECEPVAACRLTVRDNGIGFDEKYLDRIFQVFQRLHGRDEYEGTGVGLAICRKIVERHGGGITARSRVGDGAAFVVTLPLRHQDPPAPP